MTVTSDPYTTSLRGLRTETGEIDYAAYDRLARIERAVAFAMVGRWIGQIAFAAVERVAAVVDAKSHRASAH